MVQFLCMLTNYVLSLQQVMITTECWLSLILFFLIETTFCSCLILRMNQWGVKFKSRPATLFRWALCAASISILAPGKNSRACPNLLIFSCYLRRLSLWFSPIHRAGYTQNRRFANTNVCRKTTTTPTGRRISANRFSDSGSRPSDNTVGTTTARRNIPS